uniref:Tumor necrosis factor ligand superfamily member 6 n=1 Tax=Crocodylus porosus TaxID=8502 RepID=A0A7M4E7A1_CROPO
MHVRREGCLTLLFVFLLPDGYFFPFPLKYNIIFLSVFCIRKSGQKGLPLEWEAIYGHAFTSSIQYKQGSLMINETGLYFVYSSVFFRGEFCNNQPLDHTVYKRNPGYLGNQVLMEDRRMNYCATQKMWAGNSYLGALFNLTRMDRLYVNVSKIALVHFEESKTFFGVFKL